MGGVVGTWVGRGVQEVVGVMVMVVVMMMTEGGGGVSLLGGASLGVT